MLSRLVLKLQTQVILSDLIFLSGIIGSPPHLACVLYADWLAPHECP